MPLLDHFHPPVSQRRSWEGFHSLWAAAIVETLNRDILSEEYYADMQVHIGSQVEVDVASLAESRGSGDRSATATSTRTWTPLATDLVMPTVFPDEIEVQVFTTITGATWGKEKRRGKRTCHYQCHTHSNSHTYISLL